MPAHPMYEDLKTVTLNLDGESRKQLVDLVRAEKSNKSAVVRRLIDRAHAAFLRNQVHSSEDFISVEQPADIAA